MRVLDLETVHVAPDTGGKGWAVRVEGGDGRVVTFRTEHDALAYGRDYARLCNATLVAYFADGRVRYTERPAPRGSGS